MTDTPEIREKFDAAEPIEQSPDIQMPIEAGGSDDEMPPMHDEGGRWVPDEPEPDPDDLAWRGAQFPTNDAGNGQRFAHYYGDQARFVPRVGWFKWDDRRWLLDPDGISVRRLAQTVQHRIVEEIPHLVLDDWQLAEIDKEPQYVATVEWLESIPEDERTPEQKVELTDARTGLGFVRKLKDRRAGIKSDHRNFAKSSGNKGRIDAMLTEATTSLNRVVDDLDVDPLTINTESGLLRLRVDRHGDTKTAHMQLEQHQRDAAITGSNRQQMITKLVPAEFDPDAQCPTFHRFLERIQPEAEMRAFLQRWWGLNLTAMQVQMFLFQYGAGANGKSVLADLMKRILGDYATTVKIKSLVGRNNKSGADATPDLMPLVGARCALASEPEEGDRLQEGMIKEMTGGEPILVRQLHSDFIEIRPFFKLTISGNHKPDIRGTDDGIWRRVLLVPFDVQIPENERDDKLIDKLWQERSGILNWLLEGLKDYLEQGLRPPQKVVDATREYRADSDPVGNYLQEACQVTGEPTDFIYARDLIAGFNHWLSQRGEGKWGERTISLRIKDKANRYADPTTGKKYSPAKRDATGYRGIRFVEAFKTSLDSGQSAGMSPSNEPTPYSPDDFAP